MDQRVGHAAVVFCVAAFAVASMPRSAEAQYIAACRGVYLAPDTEGCALVVEERGCSTLCAASNFDRQCSSDAYHSCASGSNPPDASCVADCAVDCLGTCEPDASGFDCLDDCFANEEAECSAYCSRYPESSLALAQCQAACETTFIANCDSSCSSTSATDGCGPKCDASCDGSCAARINVEDELGCETGFEVCYGGFFGDCRRACQESTGALFCDGQWVHGPDLEACIAEIESTLGITVERNGSATCADSMCGSEGAGCSAVLGPGPPDESWPLWTMVALLLCAARRRRARRPARATGRSGRR